MEELLQYFFRYVAVDTQSCEESQTSPSTPGQLELAALAAEDLRRIGAESVRISETGYVYAELPPSAGMENVPPLGWIAHMDTAAEASGHNVKPQLVSYTGGILTLPDGKELDPDQFPVLRRMIGNTLVTSDGTTLLGADDKAGMAEIVTAASLLIRRQIPHGRICIAFTPDEEIGRGTDHFDIPGFGAKFAYTMDGSEAGALEYQNFNAAGAAVSFRGVPVHPGYAKGILVNALHMAAEFDALLPAEERPEHTAEFQGFFHWLHCTGSSASAESEYLIRDHDSAQFARRKEQMVQIAETMNHRYGAGAVQVTVKDQYANMAQIIAQYPFLIAAAEDAVRRAGLKVAFPPVRGGTDGARLSEMGLPCPNLGTGGYNFHGEREFASVPEMEASVMVLCHLAEHWDRFVPEEMR
ncbi:MAG: peptidase T [Lentisphaeria bacterium]|nr:peptidase T [Lentisphaeria bacterium]